ncbi:Panacea domain-containing protein [Vibrio europaeus]|uniref:Panacea domain-containing protein n=1 Tax=Vibrio europaeus TaxID=300876 RepID=UPI00233FF635|nr:Panacea domain-containing protein [Vibrio europaeus]MDC5850905.1 Panacea domain-containing protein [Vibrio europaeus]
MFSEEKVTQMAAYFLLRNDRRLPYIKLIKLLYLAERKAFEKWGTSMSGDRLVSMPYGPVLSQTYNLIQAHAPEETSPWQTCIKDEADHEVSLKDELDLDDLDELSRSDCRILDSVFELYGHMKPFELVDYTHRECAEWEDPNGSSYPIRPDSIFRALGKNDEQVEKLMEKYREDQALESIRASLR